MAPKPRKALPQRDPHLLERDGYITPDELAAFLVKAPGTLDQWSSRGDGPKFIKIGRDRRYWPEDVKAWLAGLAGEQEAREQERRGTAA